jgi:hypothetical protein
MMLGISTAVESGQQYADAIVPTTASMAKLVSSGMLTNLVSLPYFDINAKYLDSQLTPAVTANHSAYALLGDVTMSVEDYYCVFYNRDILSQMSERSPAEYFSSGEWLWSEFSRIALAASKTGYKGYASTDSVQELTQTVFYSSGLALSTTGYGSAPTLSEDYAALDAVSRETNTVLAAGHTSKTGDDAVDDFIAGKTAFLIAKLSTSEALSQSSVKWGLAPLPRMTSDQPETYSPVSQTAESLCVPAGQKDSARTGMILSALCAASYGKITDALKKNYIYFNLTGNDDALMLDVIAGSGFSYAPLFYSRGYTAFSTLACDAVYSASVSGSDFESLIKRGQAAFNELINKEFR